MPREHAVERDRRILAKAEELAAELKREPTRRELAAACGCSPSRVQAAYNRQRPPEPEPDPPPGEDAEPESEPSPARRRRHLLEVARLVVVAAWNASHSYHLPAGLTAALRPLRRRTGWQDELRALVEAAQRPMAIPELPEGEAEDTVATLRGFLAQIRALLATGNLSNSEALRATQSAAEMVLRIEKLSPAPERAGKREVDAAALDEWQAQALDKLRRVSGRLADERREIVARCRQEGLLTPEAREVLRRLGELPATENDT